MTANTSKIALNWSSGKDAALAYFYVQKETNVDVRLLLTTFSQEHKRVSMHGVAEDIVAMQAGAMNLPLQKIYLPQAATMQTYDNIMLQHNSRLHKQGIDTLAYGDIFLEDLKAYREQQADAAQMHTTFPLWKKDTRLLVGELEDAGIEAIIVCVNARLLGKEFLGRRIDRSLLHELPTGIDPCGENGEFHTLVVNAPYFSEALKIKTGEAVYKTYSPADADTKWDTGFYFLDVLPQL